MIGFTLCSNNYLALARSLAATWTTHHPGATFVIGLVDTRARSVDYSFSGDVRVIEVAELCIPDFEGLIGKYNITELNTAVKPYYFAYLFDRFSDNKVVYLDPDILLFQPLRLVEQLLDRHSFVVTPHICSPVDEGKGPTDYNILRTGVFNLGFLGVSRGPHLPPFLAWWQDRMARFAYRRDDDGLFYDQIWMNYIPAFYSDSHVLRDLGHNVANWNLHERKISFAQGQYLINDTVNLVFFHFSHYKLDQPDVLASYNSRYSFETRPDIKPLFTLYRETVMSNGHDTLKKIPCFYSEGNHARYSGKDGRAQAKRMKSRLKGAGRVVVAIPIIHKTVSKLARLL